MPKARKPKKRGGIVRGSEPYKEEYHTKKEYLKGVQPFSRADFDAWMSKNTTKKRGGSTLSATKSAAKRTQQAARVAQTQTLRSPPVAAPTSVSRRGPVSFEEAFHSLTPEQLAAEMKRMNDVIGGNYRSKENIDRAAKLFADLLEGRPDKLSQRDQNWLEQSPWTDLYHRAKVKADKRYATTQKLQEGIMPAFQALSRASAGSQAVKDETYRNAKRDISEGIGTSSDYRIVQNYEAGSKSILDDLQDIGNLYIDNPVFHGVKDFLHSTLGNEDVQKVLNPLINAAAAIPGYGKAIKGAYEGAKQVEEGLQKVPYRLNTEYERRSQEALEQAQRESQGALQRSLETGFETGGGSMRRKRRKCLLVSKSKRH